MERSADGPDGLGVNFGIGGAKKCRILEQLVREKAPSAKIPGSEPDRS